jgi:pimeloyl-ACP methyl ester carboxylesterase
VNLQSHLASLRRSFLPGILVGHAVFATAGRQTETMSGTWRLPTASAVHEVTMPDGASVYLRRHGNPKGPRMLVSHGCGLSADAYYPFWSLLSERFDLFLYDYRNHGWNPVSDLQAHNIPTFVQDCESVLRAVGRNYGEKPVIGVFHSLSALVALLHEERWKGFSALVLFDPPIQPPGGRPEDLLELGERISSTARRKQDQFENREDLANLFRQIPSYRLLLPGVPDLFAATILRLRPTGQAGGREGYELCCPREYEAQIYEYLFGWAMRVDLKSISCPVKVIGADPTERFSFMPSMDLSALVELNYDFLPETTHFLQMEKPEQCAALTIEFLEGLEVI